MNRNAHNAPKEGLQEHRTMLTNDAAPRHDVHNVSDERIAVVPSRSRHADFETTVDGDVVIVQPSFDEEAKSFDKQADWQERSPKQVDGKEGGVEPRNPSSPSSPTKARHTRNLSAHFFDATSLNRTSSHDSPDMYVGKDDRKHRRMMSGDVSNPNFAHRRLNSIGASATVQRTQHQRVDSAGLDILSAAADATREELAQAVGDKNFRAPNPTTSGTTSHRFMQPPHSRRVEGPPPYYYHGPYDSHAGYQMMQPPPPTYSARPNFPSQQYSSYPKGMMYPPQPRPDVKVQWEGGAREHQGSQTFVTAMGIGGNKTMVPKTDANAIPSHIQHHRRMSSFSSLGLGTLFPSAAPEKEVHPLKVPSASHHRSTSSSISFLNALDVAGMEGANDETFLRTLHEAQEKPAETLCRPCEPEEEEETKKHLANGGASKRARRKCTVEGCANRVVQGGLCISHGAKRKTCKYPGCSKNVKKAGLCSTHGPARKRCEHPGCGKVAVQGGRCIAHGAKKKLCSVDDCPKQAILGGMCKKHHDMSNAKPTHTRGLSIFNEFSADAVQSLINSETKSTRSW